MIYEEWNRDQSAHPAHYKLGAMHNASSTSIHYRNLSCNIIPTESAQVQGTKRAYILSIDTHICLEA